MCSRLTVKLPVKWATVATHTRASMSRHLSFETRCQTLQFQQLRRMNIVNLLTSCNFFFPFFFSCLFLLVPYKLSLSNEKSQTIEGSRFTLVNTTTWITNAREESGVSLIVKTNVDQQELSHEVKEKRIYMNPDYYSVDELDLWITGNHDYGVNNWKKTLKANVEISTIDHVKIELHEDEEN